MEARQLLSTLGLAERPGPAVAETFSAPGARHRVLMQAERLGVVHGFRAFHGRTLDSGQEEAWFRFQLARSGQQLHEANVSYSGPPGSLNVEIYSPAGRLLASSFGDRNPAEVGLDGLPRGGYLLRIARAPGSASEPIGYDLSFEAPTAWVREDGLNNHSATQATALGTIRGPREFAGLAINRGNDWFAFRLDRPAQAGASVQIAFDNALGDLDLELYRRVRGGLDFVERSSGLGDVERIGLDGQGAGIYFVRAFGYQGASNPDYRLIVQPWGDPPATATSIVDVSPLDGPADPSGWADQHLATPALRTLVASSMADDGELTRTDMLALFDAVRADGIVSEDEYRDLRLIVQDSTVLVMADSVRNLSSKVVLPNIANSRFLGEPLGDLAPGSTSDQLDRLVGKWFRGEDLPIATIRKGGTPEYGYGTASGVLFGDGGPHFTDAAQGSVGDCYLIASLAAIAATDPQAIGEIITDNGDGTFTVRFTYDADGSTYHDYVTVDRRFPAQQRAPEEGDPTGSDEAGTFVFALAGKRLDDPDVVLWPALIEKAFAQWSESGLNRNLPVEAHVNSYAPLDLGGMMDKTIPQLLGRFHLGLTALPGIAAIAPGLRRVPTFDSILEASRRDPIGFGTPPQIRNDPALVSNHAYALVGHDPAAQTLTIYNPWGVDSGPFKMLITRTVPQVISSFQAYMHSGPA